MYAFSLVVCAAARTVRTKKLKFTDGNTRFQLARTNAPKVTTRLLTCDVTDNA